MPLPLPDLDTRRWTDLIAEARGVLPSYAPDWTDFNASDPGVTLLELLAHVVEQDLYRANRVPPATLVGLLALAGFRPSGARPAEVVLAIGPDRTTGERHDDSSGVPARVEAGTVYRSPGGIGAVTLDPVTPSGAQVTAVLRGLEAAAGADEPEPGLVDVTPALASGSGVLPFGADPRPGAALYLGFAAPLPSAAPVNMWVGADEPSGPDAGPGPHHDARIAWELLTGTHEEPGWAELTVSRDDTRALTRSGLVVVCATGSQLARSYPAVRGQRWWLRCRLAAGGYDVAPRLNAVALDATAARQQDAITGGWRFAPQARTVGLAPGATTRLAGLRLDPAGQVVDLELDPSGAGPAVQVPAVQVPGRLDLPVALLGRADGGPDLVLDVPVAAALRDSLEVWTAAGGGWQRWTVTGDLTAVGPAEYVVAIEPSGRSLRFGDGAAGLVPPEGAAVLALGAHTAGSAGNLAAGSRWRPASGAGPDAVNPAPASGGSDPEDLAAVAARAVAELTASERLVEIAAGAPTLDQLDPALVRSVPAPARAVTALDMERIARDVPGTAVSRVRAWPGVDVEAPGLSAPGTVSVVVVPYLPADRPQAGAGLLTAIRRELHRRRVVGTRLVVRGPGYRSVAVAATVTASSGADPDRVLAAAAAALDTYLDPRRGGPAGRGWPFGRTVFRAEVLHVIVTVPGVDYVGAVEIFGDGASAGCDDLPIGPRVLPIPAAHRLTVRRG